MTGLPNNEGSSSSSTAAKNASRSTCRMVASSRTSDAGPAHHATVDAQTFAGGSEHVVMERGAGTRAPPVTQPRGQRLAHPRRARCEPFITLVRWNERGFDHDAIG